MKDSTPKTTRSALCAWRYVAVFMASAVATCAVLGAGVAGVRAWQSGGDVRPARLVFLAAVDDDADTPAARGVTHRPAETDAWQPAARASSANVASRPHAADPVAGADASPPTAGQSPPAQSHRSAQLQRLFDAIRQVESYDGRKTVGDNGRSRGSYHISAAYWTDACRSAGSSWPYRWVYQDDLSEQVMLWYWARWCPNSLAAVRAGRATASQLATLARIHNGGPRGCRKRSTLQYWRRVRRELPGR